MVLERLLDYLRPALVEAGYWDEMVAVIEHTLLVGTSARRQLDTFGKAEELDDVVDSLVRETMLPAVALNDAPFGS